MERKTRNGKREYQTFTRLQMQIDYSVDEMAEAIETVLNFIEICKSNVNEKNKRLKEYAEELEKKDKIIEAMANFILVLVPNHCYDEKPPAIMDIDWVKQYFERRIEQ